MHHPQVVVDRVDVLGRPAGLPHLAGDQLGECLRDHPHRVRAQPADQPRRRREQIVAGQDRDVVAPAGVGAGRAAADVRLVHHVVVVERGQVHQLDDRARDRHLPRVGVGPQLRGQHREQRAEPLAAGLEQVHHRVADDLVALAELLADQRLDAGNAVADTCGERGVAELDPRHHGRWCFHPSNILGSMDSRGQSQAQR